MNKVLLISLISLLTSCQEMSTKTQVTNTKDSLLVDYMSFISQFTDYSFVDWESFHRLSTQQNKADWGRLVYVHSSWEECGAASNYWELLQNARLEVHRRSIPLRAISSRKMKRRLDALERGFDEVFIVLVGQEYYLRCFQDVFDEVIPPLVDALVE